MESGNWQHLEIKDNVPANWELSPASSNILLVAMNMPGYYSLPVRILSLVGSTADDLANRFNIRFIEGSILESHERILDCIKSMAPDIIGFSVNIWNQQLIIKLAEQIKKILPDVKLLAGGQEVTNSVHNPLHALQQFDYIIDGEGEIPFHQFLLEWDPVAKALINPNNVTGLHYYKADITPVFTGPAAIVDKLDNLPSVILAGLIDPKLCVKKLGVMIESARGCPFRCGYCFEGGYNRKVRTTSLKRLIAEMEYMVDKGAGYFHLLDPILCNSNPERLKFISDYFTSLRKKKKGAIILVEAYAQHITKEIASCLKQGFIVDIGLQTINKSTNEVINRPFDKDRFCEGIRYLQDTTASFNIYLICGLPYETMETFFQGILFALKQNPTKIFFNELQLLNGTALRKKAEEYGYEFNPLPQYEIYANPWMSKRAMQITLTAARMLGRSYNLNGRSIFASAPWYSTPLSIDHGEVIMALDSPCANSCSGCVQSGEKNFHPEKWDALEKSKGCLTGKDASIRVGNRIDEKSLLKFCGRMPLASVLRTKVSAAPDFFESPERINRLFQTGTWHYTTFLTAPDAENDSDEKRFISELGFLESLNRTIPLPGAAVLEPYLEIKLLPGNADPDGYVFAIEKITERRATIITVPLELDDKDQNWQVALARAFDLCMAKGHWLRLPEKMMRYALAEENNDRVIASLKQMNLISNDDSRPVCYRTA